MGGVWGRDLPLETCAHKERGGEKRTLDTKDTLGRDGREGYSSEVSRSSGHGNVRAPSPSSFSSSAAASGFGFASTRDAAAATSTLFIFFARFVFSFAL